MPDKILFENLLAAYSDENLNRISRELIALYKNGSFIKIREIANSISRFILIDEEKDARCFSKLIMLYHPDKGRVIRDELRNLHEKKDTGALEKYQHILMLDNPIGTSLTNTDENIGYKPEYTWDGKEGDGFSFTGHESTSQNEAEPEWADFEKSFYNMIKIREYGNVDTEFPSYYLEDFDEFEMAHSGLENLDGAEHCIHARMLDFTGNNISSIDNLWELNKVEELYLAHNQIGYIDVLSNLTNLKILDLSKNQIDDITPLLELDKLEFVNLQGNPVPAKQTEQLRKNGCIVLC